MPVYLFTEIESYDEKWNSFPKEMETVMEIHDEILKRNIKAFSGKIIKHTGNGFFAVFDSGEPLLSCFQIQKELGHISFRGIGELKINFGLNSGDSINRKFSETIGQSEDYFGASVNLAANILSVANGGQILFTNDVLQKCKIPQGGKIKSPVIVELKDINLTIELLQLSRSDAADKDISPIKNISKEKSNRIQTIVKDVTDILKTITSSYFEKKKMAYLLSLNDGKEFELYEGKNIIGRKGGDIKIDVELGDDKMVSRVHALITIIKSADNDHIMILTDNGEVNNGIPSTNGVFLNGCDKRISKDDEIILKQEDEIKIGSTNLIFGFADSSEFGNIIFGI